MNTPAVWLAEGCRCVTSHRPRGSQWFPLLPGMLPSCTAAHLRGRTHWFKPELDRLCFCCFWFLFKSHFVLYFASVQVPPLMSLVLLKWIYINIVIHRQHFRVEFSGKGHQTGVTMEQGNGAEFTDTETNGCARSVQEVTKIMCTRVAWYLVP